MPPLSVYVAEKDIFLPTKSADSKIFAETKLPAFKFVFRSVEIDPGISTPSTNQLVLKEPVTDGIPSASVQFLVAVKYSPCLAVPVMCIVPTGKSLTAVTFIETVAAAESIDPSLALNVNESVPLKLALGVYV